MSWGVPPWGSARLADPLFQFITARGDKGVPTLLQQWKKASLSDDAMQLLISMIRANPTARPSVAACLASEWLKAFADTPVRLHEGFD
jgi:hypothetical protein